MTLANERYGRHYAGGEEALFGEPVRAAPRGPDFEKIRKSPAFVSLRRKQRWFVFPVSLLFMAWYMTFVLLAAYAHAFMSRPVLGLINVGMVLGLLQFVSTVVIMLLYCRYAKRTLEPATARVRDSSEARS